MKYLADNWYWISGLLVLVMSVINTATKHWSTHTGPVKWLLFVAEILSVLKSAGEPAGKLGNIKAPGKVIGSNAVFPWVLLIAFGLCSGCASFGAMRAIDTSVKGVQLVSDKIMPKIHSECMGRAKTCATKGDKECVWWSTCNSNRDKFKLAVDSAQDALAIIANVVESYCKDHQEVEACK